MRKSSVPRLGHYVTALAKKAQRAVWAEFGYALFPSTIFLAVNNRCNLLCRMCDVGRANRYHQQLGETEWTFSRNLMTKEQMNVETWKKLVDDVSHFKPLIAITSTEPLLYEGLIDLVDHCHNKGLRVEVTTNGFLLEQFADLFLKKKLDILSISIDGPPDTHDKIRGVKGAFEKATGPMRHILERRTGKTPLVQVNYTICDLNFDKLVETLPYIECDQLTFSHLNFVTEEMAKVHNAQCRYRVTPAGLSEVSLEAIDLNVLWDQIQKVKEIDKAYPVTLAPELTRDELEGFYRRPMQFLRGHSSCKAIWSVGQILADGNITGSTRCFDTARLGNIQNQSFTALWNGPILRDFRKYLRRNGGAYPACSRCCGLL